MNTNEIAHLRTNIQLEYEAATRGLSALSQGAARHKIITTRMERISSYVDALAALVGIEQAAVLLAETLEGSILSKPQPQEELSQQ